MEPATVPRDLHLGLHTDMAPEIEPIAAAYSAIESVIRHGDGWNVWGEPLGDPGEPETPRPGDPDGSFNDATTEHVILRFNVPAIGDSYQDVEVVADYLLGTGLLVRMGGLPGHYEPGTLLCLTNCDDWSQLGNRGRVRTWPA